MNYPEFFSQFGDLNNADILSAELLRREGETSSERFKVFHSALESLSGIKAKHKDYSRSSVLIGEAEELDEKTQTLVRETLESLIPWRKGPFSIFGTEVDSEWRSDFKWDRVLSHLDSLDGKVVGDIGAGNGYFMFRALQENPSVVLGFDPVPRFHFMFRALNSLATESRLAHAMLGWEQLQHFPQYFDTIFLMGIVYHHRSPLDILDAVHYALKPGGQLILESMGIPGDSGNALFPSGRYAGGKGMYFLPDSTALQHWLSRTKFRDIQLFYSQKLSIEEQRKTEWAPVDSLSEFLDAGGEKTVEGYPAPWRHYFKAYR